MTSVAAFILQAIGTTPLVQLIRVVPPGAGDVLVKLESANPTGADKDRMALAMIERAEARGALRSGMRVIEFTGGSIRCLTGDLFQAPAHEQKTA